MRRLGGGGGVEPNLTWRLGKYHVFFFQQETVKFRENCVKISNNNNNNTRFLINILKGFLSAALLRYIN